MAFQAHNIPWTQLTSHFKYVETNPRCWGITNYYAKRKPHPGNDIAYFVDCFAKTVEEHSRCERAKYVNSQSTKPLPDHLVITDDVLKRIAPTVKGYRYTNSDPGLRSCASMYVRPTCPPSQYPVRDEDRTASMFTIPPRPGWGSSCRDAFLDRYHEFEYTAMIKTLLLHGEMDPLFQLAAYDPERLAGSWRMGLTDCQESDQGWREVRDLALYPFVCLNFLYAMRMASGNDDHHSAVGQDYRNSKAYQIMLARCTGTKEFGCYIRDSALDLETFPHRQFFGTRKGRFRNEQYYPPKDSDFRSFYGKVPLAKLQNMNGAVPEPYKPTAEDVDAVFLTLRRAGLPAEIVGDILDRADYTWQRRSRYADDPLHPDNRDELRRYLKFCWIAMVRCDLLAKACGKRLHWVDDVSHCVHDMFGVHDPRLRREECDLGETDWQTDLMERRGWWIRWLAG